MRVLIVEDDNEKLAKLAAVVTQSVKDSIIEEARSSQTAQALLKSYEYDLMLLDLAIPKRIDEEPSPGEGLALLSALTERVGRFKMPVNVIAVTAYEEEAARAQPTFDERLVPVLLYTRESTDWEVPLRLWINFAISSAAKKEIEPRNRFGFDVAILVALEKPELAAIRSLPWNWREDQNDDDDTRYFTGTSKNGLRIVAASCPFVGLPIAAILATKLIARFKPRFIIHAGIAAGVRGQAEIGDVLVADPSWDWGSGKYTLENNEVVFYAAPFQIALSEDLRSKIRRIADDDTALAQVKADWSGAKPASSLSVKLGPVASGAAVLADGETRDRIRHQHRKLIGIDMETYGVMAAAQFCSHPRPLAISLKSCCDFADGAKNDEYQPYAAFTSARVIQLLIESYLSKSIVSG